jgi:hypothetical protein
VSDAVFSVGGPSNRSLLTLGAAAARESFNDALIFAGRHLFDLRPGGLDLLAGRLAGSRVTMSEIGRR